MKNVQLATAEVSHDGCNDLAQDRRLRFVGAAESRFGRNRRGRKTSGRLAAADWRPGSRRCSKSAQAKEERATAEKSFHERRCSPGSATCAAGDSSDLNGCQG